MPVLMIQNPETVLINLRMIRETMDQTTRLKAMSQRMGTFRPFVSALGNSSKRVRMVTMQPLGQTPIC
jgi:hypothetical protein